jgi:GNAT superfamily N-acetyltransferase
MAGVRFVAEPSDSPAASALYQAFVADIVDRYPGWTPADAGRSQTAVFSSPSGAWLVGYVGGEPVACGGLERNGADRAEIRRVFVHRAWRGESIGRALLDALMEQARLLGYRRVCLDTGDNQPEALGLFRAIGFRESEPFNANPFATYWLELELD